MVDRIGYLSVNLHYNYHFTIRGFGMDKIEIAQLLSKKIKLVRTEKGYSQDKMADVLGLSKKTLVQIEKERQVANWSTVVTLCALFRDSEILQTTLGNDPIEVLEVVVHETVTSPKDKTLGGKVWWKEIEHKNGYRLQQNLISQHYRILDGDDYRYFSSFSKDEALNYLKGL